MRRIDYLNERRQLAKAYLDFVSRQDVPMATTDGTWHRAWKEYRKAESDYQIANALIMAGRREKAHAP